MPWKNKHVEQAMYGGCTPRVLNTQLQEDGNDKLACLKASVECFQEDVCDCFVINVNWLGFTLGRIRVHVKCSSLHVKKEFIWNQKPLRNGENMLERSSREEKVVSMPYLIQAVHICKIQYLFNSKTNTNYSLLPRFSKSRFANLTVYCKVYIFFRIVFSIFHFSVETSPTVKHRSFLPTHSYAPVTAVLIPESYPVPCVMCNDTKTCSFRHGIFNKYIELES